MADAFRLGFIGAGNMAESISRGVIKAGVLPPSSIRTAHRCPKRRSVFQSFGVQILETNQQVNERLLALIPFIFSCMILLGFGVCMLE